jgi:hypothetical protein
VYSGVGENDVNATLQLDMRDPCPQERQTPTKGGPTHHGDWPIRPTDKMDDVKPRLYMIMKHEEEKDSTLGRSGTVWGR